MGIITTNMISAASTRAESESTASSGGNEGRAPSSWGDSS